MLFRSSWGTSVVLHLALGLIIMAVAHQMLEEAPPVQVETMVIERPKDMVYREESAEKSRSVYEEVSRETSSWVFKETTNPLPDMTDNKMKQVELFGVSGGGSAFGGMSGFGAGRGGGSGGGSFFGVGASARDIIYVVDRSGSMTDSFMYVKHELIRSISNLKRDQQFHVIFYSSGPGVEMPARKLVPATEANKQAAYDFINGLYPEGQTDPSDALEKAFRQKPQVIHLLTDGEFDPSILTLINRLNTSKQVTVNTICFLYTMGEELCIKIAGQNNGVYKYIGQEWIKSLGSN